MIAFSFAMRKTEVHTERLEERLRGAISERVREQRRKSKTRKAPDGLPVQCPQEAHSAHSHASHDGEDLAPQLGV